MATQSKVKITSRKIVSLALLLAWLVSGCTSPTGAVSGNSGATTWIEAPLDGRILPKEPISFTVYATDPGGVTGISLRLNDSTLGNFASRSLSGEGNSRMARLDYSWQPPAEGTYVLTAQTLGASGASGNLATVTFCVVACQPGEASLPKIPTSSLTATPTIATLAVTPTAATPTLEPPTITSFPGLSVKFWASPAYVNAGGCTTLYWEVSGSRNIRLDGNLQPASGSQYVCLCQTKKFTLNVEDLSGATQSHFVIVEVYGSCTAPTTEPPPPSTEPPLPQDTSGPDIGSVSIFWDGCQVYGQGAISDPSGVSWAKFGYNLNGQGWNWVWMSASGGNWVTEIGIPVSSGLETPVGTIQYRLQTGDTLGNESQSGISSYNYMGCG